MTTAVVSSGSVTDVVADLMAAVQALVQAPVRDWARLGDEALVGVLRQVEVLRRRVEAVEVTLVGQVQSRDLAGRASVSSTRRYLVGLLRISPGEAARRVRHAALLGPRVQVSGAVLPPVLPRPAAAQAAGQLSGEHVAVIARAYERLPAGTDPHAWDNAEQLLTDAAASFDPHSLTVLARRVSDYLDPDGQLSTHTDRARRRSLSITPTPEGMYRLTAHLDTHTGMLARALIDSHATPHTTATTTTTDTTTHTPSADAGVGQVSGLAGTPASGMYARAAADPRTPTQRRHDALHTLLTHAARTGNHPTTGGIPAALTITMTLDQYLTHRGLAHDTYGQPLTIPDALTATDEADITWLIHHPHTPNTTPGSGTGTGTGIGTGTSSDTSPGNTSPPADTRAHTTGTGSRSGTDSGTGTGYGTGTGSDTGSDTGTDSGTGTGTGTGAGAWIDPHLFTTTRIGEVLHLARTRRIATHTQTLALHARDQGCTFPGCDTPPTWTQRHHIIPWRHGGTTDLTNLCLLCGPHHRQIDTGGWTITMHHGHPYYTPPPWIDPDQKPLRNLRL